MAQTSEPNLNSTNNLSLLTTEDFTTPTTPITTPTPTTPEPSSSSSSSSSSSYSVTFPNDRLSLPFAIRLPLTTFLALSTGFVLGATHGGRRNALRFRAENAHRLPTSEVGWYLYHKSKNYHAMLGGVKEGARMGVKIGVWAGMFFAVEEAVDRMRGAFVKRVYGFRERRREERARTRVPGQGQVREVDRGLGLEMVGDGTRGPVVWVQRDFMSTVIAALGTAGAFSAWNRFPIQTAARMARMSLKVGLGFGIFQDFVGFMRGRRLGYVEFVKRHVFGKVDDTTRLATA